jgi:integrase
MATIREKGPYQWQVQIRRKGWPNQNVTFRTRKDDEAWSRRAEADMDRGLFVDQTEGRQTTLRDLIEIYLVHVTAHRPSLHSRVGEALRLKRFLRDERALCSHAVVNLSPEHFEDYRDRRLQHRMRNGKTIAPGTVKRELTTLKRVIDYRKRRLGLLVNPVNTEDVKRPAVNDERDVRLSSAERERLLQACTDARNPWLRAFVELGFETGARRGNLLRLAWGDIDLDRKTALLRGIKNSRSPDKIINHMIGLIPTALASDPCP